MLAVIKTGGKQYLVSPGQKLKIEKLVKEVGDEVLFPEVLLLEKGNKISEVGENLLSGSGWIGSIRRPEKPAPILHPLNSGTKLKKTFRIHLVSNAILLSASRFTVNASPLPTIV